MKIHRVLTHVCFCIRSAAFIIVVTQKLVLQHPKYVTAKCTETLLPPLCIQFSLVSSLLSTFNRFEMNNLQYDPMLWFFSDLFTFLACRHNWNVLSLWSIIRHLIFWYFCKAIWVKIFALQQYKIKIRLLKCRLFVPQFHGYHCRLLDNTCCVGLRVQIVW